MNPTVLTRLADWAVGVELEDVPAIAITTAKRSILDCLGVTLAALPEPIAEVAADYLLGWGEGPASIVGRENRAPAEVAALVNGALAHALDFDDVSHTMGGHPTIPALWSALAVAEAAGASGAELLRAYCIGVEIETAVARGVNFHHYDHGWHPTATLGTFGAAAAASAVHRLPAERFATALAYATATAAGIKASFGRMTKPFQVGRAVQSGVLDAALARAGATAHLDAFEAKQGFANVYDGAGNYDLAQVTAHLGDPWDLHDPGIAIKLHPCCGGTHAAVDCGIALHHELGSAARIVRAEASIHRRRYAHLDRPSPADPLDAKFSLQHTVALALLHGVIRMDHFTDTAIRDPELVELRSRVTASPLPPDREGPEHFAAEVRVVLDDGTERTTRFERPRGRTADTALTDLDIETKFRACTDAVLDVAQQDRLIELIGRLEQLPDVSGITRILRTRSAPAARRAGPEEVTTHS
jgi:2-methylcitrate dehydratase PrpD